MKKKLISFGLLVAICTMLAAGCAPPHMAAPPPPPKPPGAPAG